MEEKLKNYLMTIGFTAPLLYRVEILIRTLIKIQSLDILDIFVSQKIDNGEYNYLIVFTEKNFIFIQNFLLQPEIHIAPLKSSITYLKINYNNYDFIEASEDSLLNVNFHIAGADLYLEPLIGYKINCNFLLEIIKNYLIPNLFEMEEKK